MWHKPAFLRHLGLKTASDQIVLRVWLNLMSEYIICAGKKQLSLCEICVWLATTIASPFSSSVSYYSNVSEVYIWWKWDWVSFLWQAEYKPFKGKSKILLCRTWVPFLLNRLSQYKEHKAAPVSREHSSFEVAWDGQKWSKVFQDGWTRPSKWKMSQIEGPLVGFQTIEIVLHLRALFI